ncbi:uncharacterized protein LOC122656694 [Telopea speciosissima]|uniref:uncharacterized protein LOC122656694 n=1 Tax=Telopea speciosissima TaxID=54955 RepID=UPI001CC7D6AF|nr:uncharacterized protein LOC122656694 [Telopea speciosissima]
MRFIDRSVDRLAMAEEKSIEEELSFPILLAERIRKAVDEAELFKVECGEVGKQVDRLSQMLRSVVRFATSTPSLYERSLRRIVADVSKNLERALTLVRKCKHSGVLRRVVNITSATDFRKALNHLDASVSDMKWLLSIFDSVASGGIVYSLPPIASNDPILSWVWSYVAFIQMGPLPDRIEAANSLASLALDNDRNKKIIVEESGVPPLLKLLKESGSPEAQIAAATALLNLATDQERVHIIAAELGIPMIVQVLIESPMRVQIWVANLVSKMAEHDPVAQEEFARENAIRPLVSLLSIDVVLDEPKPVDVKPSIHTIVENHMQMEKKQSTATTQKQNRSSHSRSSSSSSVYYPDAFGRYGHHRKDRENEKPEVKLELKISCAMALWMLSRGSVSNSRMITETKGLLCLAKLIEKEQGEVQHHCLMTVMEITAAAELNADLRRAAFKTNSPPAKAVVEQLLRVIGEVNNSPSLQIAAIKSIGSLARTFPARETRVIGPLVVQLGNKNVDVAAAAAIALGKFACPENFLCVEHSKAIIEFDGVPPLMKLLRANEVAQFHGLTLLCYLALHVGNSEALERARALTALEGAVRLVAAQNPSLKELIAKALYHLEVYQSGIHSHRQTYEP